MNILKHIYHLLPATLLLAGLSSCVDDFDINEPEEQGRECEAPSEYTDGYSLYFEMYVDRMGGDSYSLGSRSTNAQLREIEDFVDLEKLRILFFTCVDNDDDSGLSDLFLFESKSRWVSVLSDAESTAARWQVTTPVFSYGNDETSYDWTYIRKALTTRPFKIAILANRPDSIRYGDFDKQNATEGNIEFYFGNRGPYWGVEESEKNKEFFQSAESKGFKGVVSSMKSTLQTEAIHINGLHHCQWDPVYANKNYNSGNNAHYYDYILGNPNVSKDEGTTETGPINLTGAVSAWTKWKKKPKEEQVGNDIYYDDGSSKKTKLNWYFHPDRNQGIPMYGVQKFDAVPEWKEGTPFNLSERQGSSEESRFDRRYIFLLRSLVRLDLIIPKSIATVRECYLQYSNVFGRCEPLDVATPTNELWVDSHVDNGDKYTRCEWHNIYDYGPIINQTTVSSTRDKDAFMRRNAWFYGHWKSWWNFNGVNIDNYITNPKDLPYPKIYNTCIQRNGSANLEDCMVDDDSEYYHYVVYTGERNINDPSKFDTLLADNAELAHFKVNINGSDYLILITDYSNNTLLTNTNFNLLSGNKSMTNQIRAAHATSAKSGWNWPLMRNHVYTFRVTKIGSSIDSGGLNVLTVASEDRSSIPGIDFY